MNVKSNNFELVDQCVRCGLCLPHCPTYALNKNEADSPRGRIALSQGLEEGYLKPNETFLKHINGCTTCLACEDICPASVPFTEIINSTRALIRPYQSTSFKLTYVISRFVFTHELPKLLLRLFLWVYQKIGVQSIVRKLSFFNKTKIALLDSYLPAKTQLFIKNEKNITANKKIALFKGCATDVFSRDLFNETIKLMNTLGYRVEIPSGQGCCGALDHHLGETEQSIACLESNMSTFAVGEFEAIISCATACSAHLSHYAEQLDSHSSKAFSEKCFDITAFLSKELESNNVNFKPLNKKVLVHYPCSQKYHMNDRENTVSILKKIPELEIDSLLDLTSCCGASGLYMFNEKSTSKKLLNTLLDEIKKRNIDTLVTSNIGCLLHFQAGINQLGLKTKVIHPVSLIAEQIE